MVFRRENRDSRDNRNAESFNRQIETLRQSPPADDTQREPEEFEEVSYSLEPANESAAAPNRQQLPGSYSAYGRDNAPSYPTTPDAATMSYTANQPTSVIAADTIWRGDLESNGDVHIHGQVQGTITARTDIFISEDAEADATLIANSIVVAGNVKGVLRATTRLEVLPQGRITGDVIAPTVIAHDGSRVNASVRMTLTAEEQAGTPPRVSTTGRRSSRTGARF
ncbi:MAG TPA: polymer-forming cytoskeletal protein [Thermomicrobiales bacterium]|nr:polymer-forming cytoskeletal protein [Thermomicrobiales bacterium]